MPKYLFMFEKGESARGGDPDILRTFERAIRRAGLPIAFSNGFNPRERLAFASALSTGVTGGAEPASLELTEPIAPDALAARLNATLPPGIRIGSCESIPDARSSDLLNRFDRAEYVVVCACPPQTRVADIEAAVQTLLSQSSLPTTREREGRVRTIDIRPALFSLAVRPESVADSRLTLVMEVAIGEAGNARPAEVVAALAHYLPELTVRRAHRARLFASTPILKGGDCMSKDIIVNVGDRETRIAVIEDKHLVELHVERAERVVGSLYKCRVANVLPGMDASFVDIGLERNAFLYVGDVLPAGDDSADATANGNRGRDRRPRYARGGADGHEAPVPSRISPGPSGEQIIEPVLVEEELDEDADAESDVLPAADVDVDEDDAEDDGENAAAESAGTPAARPRRNLRRSVLRQQRIKDVLKVGQELLVQVIKGPRSTKGARVSTRISLPGRYLVLMPEADNLGVSRKIEDAKERDRLKKIGDKLREPGFGLIIRTEAEDKTEQELRQDMEFLLQTWRQLFERSKHMQAPALVQPDLTLLYKTIRDVFGSDVNKLVIDDPAEYEKANELLDRISPKLKGRIHLYDGALPIFDHFNLEGEIDRLLRRKVYLKSGGSLVIDETEALTVIDVNTSKYTGGSSLAETIVKTNTDAAAEIARQLRLRDIGGIIVIDFIDMNNARDKQAVIKALEAVLKKDRSRTKISNISPLGLVEMTRKRTGETLTGLMTEECPYCRGRGHLSSAESVSLLAERDLRRQAMLAQNAKKEAFLFTCHPEVAELLIGPDGTTIEELERQLQRALYVRSDASAHIEKYTIESGDMAAFEENNLNYRRAQVVECRIVRSLLKEPNKCIGWAEGYLLDLDDGAKFVGQKAKVRLTEVHRSYAVGQIVPGSNRPAET